MKITGTKKLLIIFFALLCAFAVGLGVMISRSGAPSHATDRDYVEGVGYDIAEGGEEDIPDEEALDEELSEEGDVEKEYDEVYDESVIRSIADMVNLEYELVSFYCHANDIDVELMLNTLLEEQARVDAENVDKGVFIYDRETDGELTDEMIEESQRVGTATYDERDGITQDIVLFCDEYMSGEVSLSEDIEGEDWFVSPDDISSYATYTWYFAKYSLNSKTSGHGYIQIFKGKGTSWTDITSLVATNANMVIPSGNARYLYNSGTGVAKDYYNNTTSVKSDANYNSPAYYQVGYHYTVTLEAGEGLKLTYYMATTNSNSCRITYAHYGAGGINSSIASSASTHLELIKWYGANTPNKGLTSEVYVDGDAPTGSVFYIGKGEPLNPDTNNCYFNIITWNSSAANTATGTSSSVTALPSTTGNNMISQFWTYWIEVKRNDPIKPTLVEHDAGSETTKTQIFEGDPIQLIANPDYGASMMTWSASTNANFTQVDTTVTLFSRSKHGVEVTPANIILQSSAKGTHYIRFTSLTGKWADGSTTPVTYMLVVQEQFVERPEMKMEAGVTSNRLSKVVNYTGTPQTITFTNVNKDLVGYTAAGLDEVSTSSNEFVFQQTSQGKYTINIFIKNPSGCSWKTYNNTDNLQFTFQIKEMLIDQPVMTSWPPNATREGTTITVDYNGDPQTLVLAPALEEQLIVIAAGVETTFDKDAQTCTFKVTNSGSHSITVMPNDGYLWKDGGGTNTTLTFKIVIKAQKVSFPTLKPGQDGYIDNKSIQMTFDPDPTWGGARMIITNVPRDAIICTYAMDLVDWVPSDEWYAANPDTVPQDRDCTVLTLKANRAITYVVTFALANSNYEWANPNATVPSFSLEILKFGLEAPYISDTSEFGTKYDETNGTVVREGYTKTVYWNNDSTIGQLWTAPDAMYFDLFVGGFIQGQGGFYSSDSGQIEIRIFKDSNTTNGVQLVWSSNDSGTYDGTNAFLRLKALEAGNYIINITPTDNYIWTLGDNPIYQMGVYEEIYAGIAGTNNMITFKFEVVPIFQDTLTMFSKYYGSTSWSPETLTPSTEYDGHEKNFRIGDENNRTLYYLPSQMTWALVDNSLKVIAEKGETSKYPDGFWLDVKTLTNGATVLEGYAMNAGTYIIRLALIEESTGLPSENRAWRDGKGYYIYYTFTIKAQSLGSPEILDSECGGGEGLMVYKSQNFIVAGYNGGNVQLAIHVKMHDVGGHNIISVIDTDLRGRTDNPADPFDEPGKGIMPDDPDDNPAHKFWQSTWGENTEGTQRLIVIAVDVGIYTVRLQIDNTNFRWDNDELFYDFQIIIDYANVKDIVFNYGYGDGMQEIGGNNSEYNKTYDPNTTHHITVTRSTDDFADTAFEDQFTFEVSYSNPDSMYEMSKSTYYDDCLVLDFDSANTYYIDIYLTGNYRWESAYGLVGLALRLTFKVAPKVVAVPAIIDEYEAEGDPDINNFERTKSITYNTGSLRSLLIELGDDFGAFKVDTLQTTTYLKPDNSVTALRDHQLRYVAESAGSYILVLTLSDDNNYAWDAAETVTYTLKILPRSVSVPNAFFVLQDDISDPHKDYLDIQTGVIGEQLVLDLDGVYRPVNPSYYNGKLQYIYLFGYAVENSEVNISVDVSNTANSAGLGMNNISVSGIMRGTYVYAKLVNVYTITIDFKLNAEFGTPNCHWAGTTDILPRQFELEIQKLGLDLPEIELTPIEIPNQPDAINWNNNSLTYHATYTGVSGDISIIIDNCLSSNPINFMTYNYNKSRTRYYLDEATSRFEFTITAIATVGTEYKLTISIDADNEYWIDPAVPDDTSDKYIYIVIDKLGVVAPNLLQESDGADYISFPNSKLFTYNGSTWNNSLKVENVDYDRVEYKTSVASMTAPWRDTSNGDVLVSGSTVANTGTYSLVFSLKDKTNIKWAGTANDSSDLTFSLIIDPERIAKPVLDQTNTEHNTTDAVTLTDTELKVIYYKDSGNVSIMQYIVILNFVDDTEKMTFEFISAKGFDERIKGTNTLKFGSEDVGIYQVKITPSANVGWDDGTEDAIIFTLEIGKRVYASPVIVDPGAPATVSGQTMTVSYILDTYQSLTIKGVDTNVVEYIGTTSSLPEDEIDRDLEFMGITGTDNDEYNFEAKKVATYTVTFRLLDPDNEGLDYAPSADSIVFIFIIKKLELAAPSFDLDADILLKGETVTAKKFTAVYDAQRHGVLVLNVLEDSYMTYKPVNSIYDKNTGTSKDLFYYGDPVASTVITDTIATVFNGSGVNTKFDGWFIDPTTSVSNQINRQNFILLHAGETGTYELVFTIADPNNMQWSDGTVNDQKVTFVVSKKQIPAPDYNTNVKSLPYTGEPVSFELKNIFGVQANNYVDNAGNPALRGFEYEIFEISAQPDATSTIVAETLNVDTNVLTLTAVNIGTYKVRITIKETEHTEWTTSTAITQEFTFTITKSGVTPKIEFVDPKLEDGSPDAYTQSSFNGGSYIWPKSTTVSAKITIPNLKVADNKIIMDDSLGLEVYYVNTAANSVKLSYNYQITPYYDANDLFTDPLPTADGVYPSSNPQWALEVTGGVYNLIYTFEIMYDSNVHSAYGFIPQGKYALHVDQNGASTTYEIKSVNKNFEVEADRAPFLTQDVEKHIIWQVYKVSDPSKTIYEYSLTDMQALFPTATINYWSDVTSAQAITLDFLEDNDSYGFRFTLDTFGMNGETEVRSALQSWEVDWNGTYGGKATAKYAGGYSVNFTITALDAKAYSYTSKTFTFFYQISQQAYDLDGLVWDYTAPFTYDGSTHVVALTGTLPAGLSIASYDVTGYDRNSQIAAGTYKTTVVFKSSNPNYYVPDVNNASTYISTTFQWEIIWTINKANISANWDYKVEAGDSATMSIPRLDAHGEKVEYTYYKDNGDPNPANWDIVTSFVNEEATQYRVVVKLKSDVAGSPLDYASNYILTVNGGASDNSLTFTMPKGAFVGLYVEIDGKEQHGGEPDTSITGNIHKYTVDSTGKVTTFSATVTLVGAVGLLTDSNLAVTYYNVSNTLKPISAPQEPGHYLVKIKLVNIDTSVDTNQYVLPVTEYYFDIEKGDFNKNDIYWRYEHTDANGAVTVARYDEDWGIWQIISYTDANGDPDPLKVGESIPSFVYDGRPHTVELYSADKNLTITTKNKAQINAGKFTEANGNIAAAALSYNGKLWNSPTDGADPVIKITAFEWEIEKAVIDISGLQWDYPGDYVYTVSGGVAKKFTVVMEDSTIPALLRTFVEYKTYDLDDVDEDGNPAELSSSILSDAGHYRTEFVYDSFEEDATLKQNYEIGDWPSGVDKALDWEIAVREISIPVSDGSWTVFDGNEYDLLALLSLDDDWSEYIKISIEYAVSGSSTFADYSQMGINEFGSETFASHAGKYKYTFSIVNGLNTADQINVVFMEFDSSILDYVQSTADQTTTLEVAKATMTVENWIGNDEWSTVALSGAYVSNEFVDYYFTDLGGTQVPISQVVVTSGTQFIMYVVVRDEHANDINLVAAAGQNLYHNITTLAISDAIEDQTTVLRVPYIVGYRTSNGFLHEFSYDEWKEMMIADTNFSLTVTDDGSDEINWFWYLGTNPIEDPNGDYMTAEDYLRVAEFKAKVRVSVKYSGEPITFVISDWNSGIEYSQYLDIWQGNLTQTEAADYAVTIMFKKGTTIDPYCWMIDDDGDGVLDTVNRDPVTLNFRIAFNMIPVPEIDDGMYPEYTGSEIDILEVAWGSKTAYDEWLTKYGEYFEIIGNTATSASSYTLQLKIKDIYLNTVHWDTGISAKGQPGTYTVRWTITPIYIIIPTTIYGAEIVYSGSAHSVFEILEGYSNGELSEELKALMQLAKISGDSGVNAGSYEARFMLPNTNYAWKTSTGTVINDLLQTLPWAIQKKKLDMSRIQWNYSESNPFQYTIVNGEVQDHTLLLENLPAELEEYVTYITDKQIGSTRSKMGTYTTVVYFFQDNVEYTNYSLENDPRDFLNAYPDPAGVGYAAITWQITERKFNVPEDKEIKFDGTIHDLGVAFGLPEGWDNYLDISVEYKPLNAPDSDYISYFDMVATDAFLGYSPFNLFYLGNYRVEFTIKEELNSGDSLCVIWMKGTQVETDEQIAVLTVTPLEIEIEGWKDDGNYNITIISEAYNSLSDDAKEVFEYIIRDEATGDPVTVNDIINRGAGLMYTIEFVIKSGNDYALSKGITIDCAEGVTNPYVFGNFNYPNGGEGFQSQGGKDDVVLWLPIPTLTYIGSLTGYDENGDMVIKDDTATIDKMVYNGHDRVYRINNWETYYWITSSYKDTLTNTYGVDIMAEYFIEAVGENSSWLKIIEKEALDEEGNVYVTSREAYIIVPKAGDLSVTVRFIPNLNMSWYNSELYDYEGGVFKDKGGSTVTLTPDRASKKLEVSIERAALDPITDDLLELIASMIPALDYTGQMYDLRTLKETEAMFNFLKTRYGDLLEFEGCTGLSAGDYYLIIKLKDSASSYWNLKVTETVVVNDPKNSEFYDPDYQLKWVQVSGKWTVKYVKSDGNGGYIDYNDGNYKLDVVYEMDKAVGSYIQVMDVEYVLADGLLDADGKPINSNGYKYIVDANGVATKYALVGDDNYVEYSSGTYIARYVFKEGGLLNADGTLNVDEEELYQYKTDANGRAIRYSLNANKTAYVEDPNGEFIVKYKLDSDGNVVETPIMVDGRNAIDTVKSKVTITRTLTSTDKTYKVKWTIVGSTLAAPTLNDTVLTYNGKEQSAERVLSGFRSQFMEIVEGGTGIDAGEYVAKIKITDENFTWREGVGVTEEDGITYVYVRWSIAKAKIDLSNVSWKFTDGTNYYKNGEGMVYTRINGEPVVYWAYLDNLPEAVKTSVRYKTNGVLGGNAGTDAGKYSTSFEVINADDNFEELEIPENLAESVTWYIQRRALEIPTLDETYRIFDDKPHDLREILNLQEGWEEYFTLSITYSNGGASVAYEGYEGDPYTAFGAGSYRFIFNILPGINKSAVNPSVVWLKSALPETPETPEVPETPETPETSETPETPDEPETVEVSETAVVAVEDEVAVAYVSVGEKVEVEPAVVEAEDTDVVKTVTTAQEGIETSAQQICDRIKQLVYGAQIQTCSFRKYL